MRALLISFLIYGFTGIAAAQGAAQHSPRPTPQWRPVYHYTPLKNWTNDPNGLVYLNGEYLLYNQYNPYGNEWGHMSWGHAVSTDLVHWKHLPVAIPEKTDPKRGDTTWIFSGSAVWDKANTSGFCRGKGCLVAIYTAHQPNMHKESQYIAYSNDDGRSFTDYAKNPVIDLHKKDFRDPNVFWYKPAGRWVMTVAMPAEHTVRFYGSPNLKEWTLLSEFGPKGYTDAHWECPSLTELPVEGGGERWVLMNSAAGGPRGVFMQYYVGHFDGKTFTMDKADDPVLPVDYGDCFYAAISWNNLPDDKKILIGWMIPGKRETYPWRGQMSIPRDLSLRKTGAGLRLVQEPADVIRKLLPGLPAGQRGVYKDITVDKGAVAIGKDKGLDENCFWLDAEWQVPAGTTAGFTVAGAVVGYDADKHELFVDKGDGDGKRMMIDLPGGGNTIRLQILFDKSSLEVFAGHGEKVLTTYIYPDADAKGCSAFARGGNAVIRELRLWNLSKL